jgi:C_GCAxxG_C_C family probable redox protein
MRSPLSTAINQSEPLAEALISAIRQEALELYYAHKYWCSEAVLVSLNRGLDGGLSDAQAIAMAPPLSRAMGDSGCLCGAVSGAVMGAGLLLGQDHPYRHRKQMRSCARQLHDRLLAVNGSTCCRVLSRWVKNGKKAQMEHCADLVAQAAVLAAQLVIEKRPERLALVKTDQRVRQPSILTGILRRVGHFFAHYNLAQK